MPFKLVSKKASVFNNRAQQAPAWYKGAGATEKAQSVRENMCRLLFNIQNSDRKKEKEKFYFLS